MGEISRQAEELRRGKKMSLEKAVLTATIGAISRMEQHFGRAWGQGEVEKTELQAKWAEVWDRCRREILDYSNDLIRRGK